MTTRVREPIIPVGPYIGYLVLTQGVFALMDREDALHFCQWNWAAHRRLNGFYAERNFRTPYGKRITLGLHVAIVKPQTGKISDHRNGNTLDYRKTNLREATKLQNAANRWMSSMNSSGHKGVSAFRGKWLARIMVNKKAIYLGVFATKELAIEAHTEAETRFYGEFRRVS